jgi:hypothetical protein
MLPLHRVAQDRVAPFKSLAGSAAPVTTSLRDVDDLRQIFLSRAQQEKLFAGFMRNDRAGSVSSGSNEASCADRRLACLDELAFRFARCGLRCKRCESSLCVDDGASPLMLRG